MSLDLVRAIIQVESDFDHLARSSKGAQGLMQLMPATAERFGVGDPFDPRQNIFGGVQYLRVLLDMFGGDVILASAAYNAGENAVIRYNGVPPYRETQGYVEKVRSLLGDAASALAGMTSYVPAPRSCPASRTPPPPRPAPSLAKAATAPAKGKARGEGEAEAAVLLQVEGHRGGRARGAGPARRRVHVHHHPRPRLVAPRAAAAHA